MTDVVGRPGPLGEYRYTRALPIDGPAGLTVRYTPKPQTEKSTFVMDFSPLIPHGVGIEDGDLDIFTNTVPPAQTNDWHIEQGVEVRGRRLWATLSGGKTGTDYQLRWTAYDTEGNVWPRTALCLCTDTS